MLKILVVEDDPNKLRHVATALERLPDCNPENIDQTAYANEAKRHLKEKQYDLLILDVALPARPDSLPSPEGGIGLLEEILDRASLYYRPNHIVGLTAFPDILEKFATRFGEDLWMIIQYEATSDHWAEQLRRKVEHILLTERSRPVPEYGAFLGIVAALQSPELEAVLENVPWGWNAMQLPSDSSNYHKGTYQKDGATRQAIAVAAPRMGMTAASVASMKLIAAFRPRYLAMVGIAAGIRNLCQMGDIVVADPSWDWGSGKIAGRGAGTQFQQAPHQISIDCFLRSKLNQLQADAETLDSIRREWRGPSSDRVLRMHIGPVASGSAVLADRKTVGKIVKQHRKLLGVEMETYGVYAAAQEAPLPQPKAFSIKSVCDYADERKGDEFQKYASFTSACALKEFAERYL